MKSRWVGNKIINIIGTNICPSVVGITPFGEAVSGYSFSALLDWRFSRHLKKILE